VIVNLVINLIFESGDMGSFPKPTPVVGKINIYDIAGNPLEANFGALSVDTTGHAPTYRATFRLFVPKPSTTKPLFSIQGSATKDIHIRHIRVGWDCLIGCVPANSLTLQRFSVLTGGVGIAAVPVSFDVLNPPPTAQVVQYSTLPTVATPVGGPIASEIICWTSSRQKAVSTVPVFWEFGVNAAQSLDLDSLADYVGVICAAVAPVCPWMTIQVEWTEQ
jgi:hypothetical protein